MSSTYTQQWLLAEKVIKLLKIFEEATREVSGEYASASVIIPIISALKKNISDDEDDQRCYVYEERHVKIHTGPVWKYRARILMYVSHSFS